MSLDSESLYVCKFHALHFLRLQFEQNHFLTNYGLKILRINSNIFQVLQIHFFRQIFKNPLLHLVECKLHYNCLHLSHFILLLFHRLVQCFNSDTFKFKIIIHSSIFNSTLHFIDEFKNCFDFQFMIRFLKKKFLCHLFFPIII
jgi:hypothetical protein